jgi:YegS/Rv2252/BmrU family lipid kinase
MRTLFILNPHSGRNRRRPWLAEAIRRFIAERSLDATLAVTERPGHARELAAEGVAQGAEVVVAVGGDGTMNEVAQALVHTPAALALVPCGSGNGLALHLRLPSDLRAALELAGGRGARVAVIDSGVVNGLPFFNAMGAGIDAEVSLRFNTLVKRGLPAYVRVALAVWTARRPVVCHVSGAGTGREPASALLVAVANSDQYGNNARIAPGARVDDGKLDLVVVTEAGTPAALGLVPRMFLGTLDRSRHVRRLTGERFVIERAEPGVIHTDGETHHAAARLEVAVLRSSLRLLVPLDSPAASAPAAAPEQILSLTPP